MVLQYFTQTAKTACTAGRSVWGGLARKMQKLSPNFSEVALIDVQNLQKERSSGQLARSWQQNPGTSQKLLQKSALLCIRFFSVLFTTVGFTEITRTHKYLWN